MRTSLVAIGILAGVLLSLWLWARQTVRDADREAELAAWAASSADAGR